MNRRATIYHNPRCSKSRQTLARLGMSERPIVITGQGAALGRPPKNVLRLL
jgi:arsenate reductase-like glutaredoxin family protein